MKRALNIIIRIGISGGLLFFIFRKVDFAEIGIILKEANPYLLLAALGGYFITVGLSALRWHRLLRVQGIKIPYRRTLAYYFIGFFYNNFLPTTIGGGAVRALYAGKADKKMNESFSSMLIELIIGGWVLITFALIASLLWFREVPLYVVILPLAGVFILASVLVCLLFERGFMSKFKGIIERISVFGIRDKTKEFYNALHIYKDKKKQIVEALLLSFVIQFVIAFMNLSIGIALGFKLPFMSYIIYPVIIGLLTTIPITMNGLGIREWGYGFFFAQVGLTSTEAVTLSLLFYIIGVIGSLVGGVLFPFMKLSATNSVSHSPAWEAKRND